MAAGIELGKAYVQIIPSAMGIEGELKKGLSGSAGSAGEAAGQQAGAGFVSNLKKMIVASGIGAAVVGTIKSALSEGSALEQSIGGIETLYKDSADKMLTYADQAYKTAGLSANEYMQTATSFSAALLQGLGGDTEKAAEITDMAIQDMSDNANKMGTDMSSIQTAYQGFAKQNYTMLDNLKLGYGGTKSEMERLLKDAQEFSGVEYNIDNLNDVYEAIHVIQGELEISARTEEEAAAIRERTGRSAEEVYAHLGTTAKEAATTMEGSAKAMKASWKNLLGKMAIGEDVGPAFQQLADSAMTFVTGNLLPMLGQVLTTLPGVLANAVTTFVPQLLQIGTDIITNMSSGISSGLPGMISQGVQGILGFISNVRENLGPLIDAGLEMIGNLAQGLVDGLPDFLAKIPEIIGELLGMITDNFPSIVEKGIEIIATLAQGLWDNLPEILSTLGDILQEMWDAVTNIDWLQLGMDVLTFIGNGLTALGSWLWDTATGLFEDAKQKITEIDWAGLGHNIINGIVEGIKNLGHKIYEALFGATDKAKRDVEAGLGVSSPSKVFRDDVGRWIPAGIAVGIEENADMVRDAMNDLATLTTQTMHPEIMARANFRAGALDTSYADSIVSGFGTVMAANTPQGGDIHMDVYLYPSGPKMGEQVVRMYDTYKLRLG